MEQSLTIYKASAGSGKTFTLAVEYIMELLQPHAEKEFEHTLAVTFTNKATAEMKGRILETLYALKNNLNDSKPYLKAIKKRFKEEGKDISEEQIKLQAGKALTAILHDYSHFRVETIDSFFQSILRNMARELGLAANLQVELSTDEIIESAVDSLIETMNNQPEVRKWVLDYVREQLDSGDKWDIVGPLKAFAGNIFKEEYQRKSEEELARISNPEIVKDFKQKMQSIKKRAEKEVQEAVDEVMSQIEDYSQISYGKNL
ncbi:MAG: UvrD-helicase domain-containing protein, partial [Bacteroidaceae bacterium]|nr:UvrD-helicase domain-containing protein [Bacteroidaceae bacterium]